MSLLIIIGIIVLCVLICVIIGGGWEVLGAIFEAIGDSFSDSDD